MFFLNQLQKPSQPQIKPRRGGKRNTEKAVKCTACVWRGKVKAKYDKKRHVAFNVSNWPEKTTMHTKRQNHVKAVVVSHSVQSSSILIRWRKEKQRKIRCHPAASASAVVSPALARWRWLSQADERQGKRGKVPVNMSTEGTPGSENLIRGDRSSYGWEKTWHGPVGSRRNHAKPARRS